MADVLLHLLRQPQPIHYLFVFLAVFREEAVAWGPHQGSLDAFGAFLAISTLQSPLLRPQHPRLGFPLLVSLRALIRRLYLTLVIQIPGPHTPAPAVKNINIELLGRRHAPSLLLVAAISSCQQPLPATAFTEVAIPPPLPGLHIAAAVTSSATFLGIAAGEHVLHADRRAEGVDIHTHLDKALQFTSLR